MTFSFMLQISCLKSVRQRLSHKMLHWWAYPFSFACCFAICYVAMECAYPLAVLCLWLPILITQRSRSFSQGLFQKAVSRYIMKPEKKELLLQLLQWMPSHGYVVDSSTRNLMLKNSQLFGRHFIPEILSKHHMALTSSKSLRRKGKWIWNYTEFKGKVFAVA